MEKVKVIIELTRSEYERICAAKSVPDMFGTDIVNGMIAIQNGTPYNPSGDLISRSDLQNLTCGIIDEESNIHQVVLLADINNAPTVVVDCKNCDGYEAGYSAGVRDTERPHGAWINHRNDCGHNIADCSLCGKTMQWHDEDEDGVPRYCWYCGADMRGKEE